MLYAHNARTVRAGANPTLSVQLTSTGPRHQLEACLQQVGDACSRLGAQLVVVRAFTDDELQQMRNRYPDVLFAAAPAGLPAMELRAIGMAVTDGDVVVFGDDTQTTPEELIARFSEIAAMTMTEPKASNDRA